MQAAAAKTQKKISLLHALIDHPRTGEDERDTARRMLKRLLAKAPQQDADTERPGHEDTRAYGSKYDRKLTTVEIAKLIRADIKLARKIAQATAEPGALKTADPIGDAPAAIKFGVRSERFAGGSSIDIVIKNIPEGWGWESRLRHGVMTDGMATSALQALAGELAAIMRAYNHDGSDITSDYFDVNFYAAVITDGGRLLA